MGFFKSLVGRGDKEEVENKKKAAAGGDNSGDEFDPEANQLEVSGTVTKISDIKKKKKKKKGDGSGSEGEEEKEIVETV